VKSMGDKVSSRRLNRAGFAGIGMAVLMAGALFAVPATATGEEAAAAAAEADNAPTGVDVEVGRQLFNDWSCGSCHVLKDAGAMGPVGPSLDGNTALTRDFVIGRVANGQGAMPGFAGALAPEEMELLADYIVQVAEK
jgi:mono/diheme cytochrome c family protein